ncbi:AAA family ATPase [Micromonospora sp. NPDC050686]|uniref:AAA family ATPase n=1 Tax=Micromonospora sp. NPDC050686 TaxID=3154631 RepID=UPI0033E269D2
MLTRLEVQGFKNLLDVDVEFGPFTCIAGANGIGKSNLFDVIEFLSYLATDSLQQASQRVRGTAGRVGSDPRDLFRDGYRSAHHRMTLAAEMIVPRQVQDDLGERTRPSATWLRYEVVLGYEPSRGEHGTGGLRVVSEDLRQVDPAQSRLRFPAAPGFLDAVVVHDDQRRVFLSTDVAATNDGVIFDLHADGSGPEKSRFTERAGRTVLSTTSTSDYPTILAVRREMQSWRRLALEPYALRAPDEAVNPEQLSSRGRHLAATLHRIAHAPDWSGDPERTYATVAGRLADLGVNVETLDVEFDEVRQTFTLFLQEKGGLRLPARALSEGTLRFLALCVLLQDADLTGLVCMEEPENGLYPAVLPAMMQLVQDLAVDPTESPVDNNPFRQVIVNTHSPAVVQLCDPDDLLLGQLKPKATPDGAIARSLSLLPFRGSWRTVPGRPTFSEADVVTYLANPSAARLRLPPGLTA